MREDVLAAIRGRKDYLARFNIREYSRAFKEYTQVYAPVYTEFVSDVKEGDDEALNGMAEDILNALEAGWKAQRFWNRASVKADEKLVLCMYLSPMLLKQENPACTRLAELLQAGWTARWPRDVYQLSDYKTIRDGFHNVVLGVDMDRMRPPKEDDE